MNAGELAALITSIGISIGAVLTAIAALINARNSAATVEHLKEELEELRKHNIIQDGVLIERESTLNQMKIRLNEKDREIERLTEKIHLWQEWGFNIGRVMNEMQLEIGFLQKQKRKTGPLPQLPNDDQSHDSE